jgi:hypothetical protein
LNNAEIVSVLGEIRTLFQHLSGRAQIVRDSGGFTLVWRKMRKSCVIGPVPGIFRNPGFSGARKVEKQKPALFT